MNGSVDDNATDVPPIGGIRKRVAEDPVVVVGLRGCCMIPVVKRLLMVHGVNPTVCEIREENDEAVLMGELADMLTAGTAGVARQRLQMLPAVFIGGRLVGGVDRLMAVHISGDLVPILREAGALWL